MAEQTPGNLHGLGAFMMGRATGGNKHLDSSIDRLEKSISRFADTLDRHGHKVASSAGSASTSGGSSQQSGAPIGNGGNWSGGHAPKSHRADAEEPRWTGGGGGGSHRGNGGGWSFGGGGGDDDGGGGGGAHSAGWGGAGRRMAGNAYSGLGGRSGIARKTFVGATIGLGVYTSNHFDSQTNEQSIAATYSYGQRFQENYRSIFGGNYTAANAADRARAGYMAATTFGGSGQALQTARRGAETLSMVNPSFTNTQGQQAVASLSTAGTFNRMRALGITTTNRSGAADPMSIARQVLQKVPGHQNIRTEAQLNAAMSPSGGINMTVQGMVTNGYIPADSAAPVLQYIRTILQGQIAGMGYGELRRNLNQARTGGNTGTGDQARENLNRIGIGNTLVGAARRHEGLSHDTEADTISGFTAGVKQSTEVLNNFRSALNKLLDGPLGDVVGGSSGVMGSGLGGVFRKLLHMNPSVGMFGGGGGSAPTMSQSSFSATGFGMGSMMTSAQSGIGASGGAATPRQSGGGRSAGGTSAGNANSGLRFIAPRPGINNMSSEQDFGKRTIGQGFHTGVDLEGGTGAPIKASAAGRVTGAGWGSSGDGGYGNTVMISHGGGFVTMYAHMSAISVKRGQMVRQGQIIGNVGNTGHYSRGSHLHFEIHKNGKPIDPKPYIGGGRRANVGSGPGAAPGGSGASAVAGTADEGTQGATMGATGSFAVGSADGGSGYGAYSEVAALGIGSGSAGGGVAGGAGAGPGGVPAQAGAGSSAGSPGAGVPGGSGAGATVRTGTYNVLHTTSDRATENALKRLMGSADSLGLQEFESSKARGGVANWLRQQGWGFYKGRGDSALTWDKDKYTAVRTGDWKMNNTTGSRGGTRVRYASYALLRDNESGAQHWEVSAHTVPNAKSQKIRQKILNEQFHSLGKLADMLEKTAPVIMLGDLNQRTKGAYWNAAALRGLVSKNKGIDHMLYDPRTTKLLGSRTVDGGASDHNAILGTFRFGSTGGGGSSQGGVRGNGGSAAQNMALGRQMAAQRGWSGAQWSALRTLWMHESGWRTNADNPTSSAYGIPQALTAMHHLGGTRYMTDPKAQINWGLNYIKGRYGNPGNAWNFWKKHHWYDEGAWNLPSDQEAVVHKGEMVVPAKMAEVVRRELTSPAVNRRGGASIVFQPGAVVVQLGAGSTMSQSEAADAGRSIVDAVVADNRIRALAEG